MSYLTTKEASALWGYSEATIRKWCKDGLLYSIQKVEKKKWQMEDSRRCGVS